MAKTKITQGPLGNGWIEEVKTPTGTKFVARWNSYVSDPSAPGGRRRVRGGSYEIGPKVHHGPAGTLKSDKAAMKEWLKICDSVMGRSQHLHPFQIADKPFRWFTEEVFEKARSTRWRETSKDAFAYYKKKVLSAFGDVPLKDMNDPAMQLWLNSLANEKYSKSVVEHCMKYLRAILEHAVEDDVLHRNPAKKLIIPENVREPDTPYLSIAEYSRLVGAMPTKRDQIMVKLLFLGALRRGELFGLQWQDHLGDNMNIVRQVNRFGKITLPKTKASCDEISIPPDLRAELDRWREWCPNSSPTAFMFQSKTGSPIHYKNWLDRVLKPAALSVGIQRISYHMFRRGFATEAHQNKEADKNIQAQLRHSSMETTRTFYMKNVPEAHKASVGSMEQAVNRQADEIRKAAEQQHPHPAQSSAHSTAA